jgi:hypothetical protein
MKMEWYRVIKTINGRRYLYLQKTYRVGQSVKTLNKYIGSAAAAGHGVPMPSFVEQMRQRFPSPITDKPFSSKERKEDEKIRYGKLADREKRQKSRIRAAKKNTAHLKPFNYFAAKLASKKK